MIATVEDYSDRLASLETIYPHGIPTAEWGVGVRRIQFSFWFYQSLLGIYAILKL